MQKLKIFQSLWAMELRHPEKPERSMEENFRMVAEAGYDGICIDPAADEIESFRNLIPLYDGFGLDCMLNAFPYSEEDMLPLLTLATECNAQLVNIIGGVMPIQPEDAVNTIHRWIAEADDAGLPVLFETHRDSLLNDLYYTLQVMELVPEMRLCADLSHFVVDREMRNPISPRDQKYIDTILARSDCFQGRVANREQVQIQLDFPQHREWVDIFRTWWKAGMRGWRRRNADDATLHFLCELGPPPYAITDANQDELSDRWQEALVIKGWIAEAWSELETEATMSK